MSDYSYEAMGQTQMAYSLRSLQHFGSNLNTRDLKAQGSV